MIYLTSKCDIKLYLLILMSYPAAFLVIIRMKFGKIKANDCSRCFISVIETSYFTDNYLIIWS